MPLWKQGTLHITIATGGLFERVVSLLTHWFAIVGPLWNRRTCILQVLLWALWKQRRPTYRMQLLLGALVKQNRLTFTLGLQLLLGALWRQSRLLNYDVVRKILYERIIHFSPKVRNIYARNTLRGAPEIGDPSQVLRLPSLIQITVYNPDNDLIWEYETDWTRSASSDMRTFSPDVCM